MGRNLSKKKSFSQKTELSEVDFALAIIEEEVAEYRMDEALKIFKLQQNIELKKHICLPKGPRTEN
jgi:hypothetical protein